MRRPSPAAGSGVDASAVQMSDSQGLAAVRITHCHSLHSCWDLSAAVFTGT